MRNFVAYPSRWRLALIGLAAAGFVVAGLWLGGVLGAPPRSNRYPDAVIFGLGWFSVFFFGLCWIMAVKKFLHAGAQLEIGADGICWQPWSDKTIPWSEITDVTSWSFKRQDMIVLHLRDPAQFPGRGLVAKFNGANRALTGGDISISLTATDRSFDEAMSAIATFRS